MMLLLVFVALIIAGVFAMSGMLTLGVIIALITGLCIFCAAHETRRDRFKRRVLRGLNHPGTEEWEWR